MKTCDLTIGITAHTEGVFAHKTMLSVQAAAELLSQHGISYEILVHLDNGDKLTRSVFQAFAKDQHFRLIEAHFGDAGPSRNNLVKNSKGKFISFLDADDLISSNWLYQAYQKLNHTQSPIIVHPEYNLTFGIGVEQQIIWRQTNSYNDVTDAFLAVGVNRWTSCSMAPRAVYLSTPFPESGHGYGNEDYWFNTELLGKGVRHHIVEDTIQFYRQRPGSRLASANQQCLVQPYNDLFAIKTFQKLDPKKVQLSIIRPDLVTKSSQTDKSQPRPSSIYRAGKKLYRFAKKRPILDITLTPFANSAVNLARYIKNRDSWAPSTAHLKYNLPQTVIDEWRKINKIENQLYPTEGSLHNLRSYYSDIFIEPGLAYHELIQPVKALPQVVFIVPWLTAGGADKLLLNYLQGIKKVHPSWQVALITTLPAKNEWADKLPSNTYLIDFGNIAKDLQLAEQQAVFTRLIEQLKCRRLHLINSEFGYQWVMRHLDLVKDNYDLDVSIFGKAPIKEAGGELYFDYADPYAVSIYPAIHKIYTDNSSTVERCVAANGFSRSKFVVEYQPSGTKMLPPIAPAKGRRPYRVLWASRVATPKNPELLKAIAKELDPSEYQIDMYGVMSSDYHKNEFTSIPTIKYHGGYDGIEALDTSSYDVFLYTSLMDGLPNILLEIAARGLPIIASDAGGIGDFIKDGHTGVLIQDYQNPDAYIEALAYARSHPAEMQEFTKNAQALITKRHSKSAYEQAVAKHFPRKVI